MAKFVTAFGRSNSGAGSMVAVGAAVGDRVIGLLWQSPNGTLLRVPATYVEPVITVADQVQTPYPLISTVAYGGAAPVFTDILGATSTAPQGTTNRTPDYANGTFIVLLEPGLVMSANGAIAATEGKVVVTKAGVCAMTIADPTNLTDDLKELTIVSATAQAHTLSNAAGSGFNNGGASSDVGTFGGAIGDGITLIAYGGKWLVKSKTNVTLA